MGPKPCYNAKDGENKGPWTEDEDLRLIQFIEAHGEGRWPALAKNAGLKRCGTSCRLRWMNYLRPNLKRGNISPDEEDLIIRLHKLLGNRWSLIAGRIPGRSDNEIKNYWNTRLNKKSHANESIGRLKSVRLTEPNVKEAAVNLTQTLNTNTNQLGERDEVIAQELNMKGSTSSNSIESENLMCPTKQNPSSCLDAGTVSAEMKLWNPLQLNFIVPSSWANSSFSYIDDSNVDNTVGYNEENGHRYSCTFDTVNVCQDFTDQMYSLPLPEVVPTDTMDDEFADFFNFIPYPY
eukprot:PITA_18358